jgi:hypothetical protein
MKKTKFFALLCCMVAMFCCIGLSSCGDDDDDNGSSLIGTWKAVSGTYEEDGETQDYDFSDNFWMTLTFTDKTVTETSFDGEDTDSDTENYILDGNEIVIPAGKGEKTIIYSLKGDTLVLTITDNEEGGTDVITLKRQK